MSDVDVVVVGCGPVGMMAALRCVQRGLSVVAVDRATEIYPLPRALGMDDEVQSVFARAGLGDDLRGCSEPLLGAEFVDRAGARLTGMEVPPGTLSPLGHPFVVTFDQPTLETALRRSAVAAGVDLRTGTDVTDVTDITDAGALVGADVHLDRGTAIRARWVIGADGASSTVRRLRGIASIDQGFDQIWLVVDTTVLDRDVRLPRLATQICDPARVVTFVPGPAAHRRWEFQLRPGESQDEMLEPATILRLLEPWVSADQVRIDRSAVYRFHAVVAERFRAGPVFLAGDAAHQMPPFNGQGMCTGIRDAENLSWKLALVARGDAGDRLLDTYDAERRPHAEGQVVHSADAGRLIDALARGGDASTEAGYGGRRPFPHLEHGLVQGDHPAVGRPLPVAPDRDAQLGDRFALLSTQPLDAGDAVTPWTSIGARALVLDADEFPGLLDDRHVVIVRPDRYVAAVTDDLAATTHALTPLLAG